ncbi:MAG: hypothetical protein EOO45_09175 [Flavobacterium sp.]|nr:MAG: hypothetical protein EOO45_09175 [Flavobacterium sp.]
MFRDAGISPTEHMLTNEEKRIVVKAFAALPPMHQRVLKQHLKSISFLDNMPNTALTSCIVKEDSVNLYHITFRAGVLHQTISEWATEKERSCFTRNDTSYNISIEAGLLNAITYVLLHEGTHVIDGSVQLISIDSIAGSSKPNAFTTAFSKGIWGNINIIGWTVKDSTLLSNRFRPGGQPLPPSEANHVYKALGTTPFVSLYATASWHEDLAELFTIYHLTTFLHQPFKVIVRKNSEEIFRYEPMKNPAVAERKKLLACFYDPA